MALPLWATNISSPAIIVVPLATPVATNISSPCLPRLRVTPLPLPLPLPPSRAVDYYDRGREKAALRRLVG